MKENAQDVGPFRLDLVLAILSRIIRTADALYSVGAIESGPSVLQHDIESALDLGGELVDFPDLTKTLRVLAAQDGMHAGDWLRMKAVEAQNPRRKPPAAVDLAIRLKGLQCTRLVARLIRRTDEGVTHEAHRVTIMNARGDVASVESPSFANALEGAITMAGARGEEEHED